MFYSWLWSILPGPLGVKVLAALVLAIAVVAILFTWVFPAIAPLLPFNDNTVDG